MEQYIPKSALVAEINKRIIDAPIDCYGHQRVWAYNDVKDIIKTFEAKEVDLEKEIANQYESNYEEYLLYEEFADIAKHFFELGLNASNPITEVNLESLVRQVIDLYLEAGEHYNSVIKEERKEHGCSDLAIKLFDGVIDAKELSIQYVLDRFKAQKGE